MSGPKSAAGQAEVSQLMLKVIEQGRAIRVRFNTEGEAKGFRFKAYSVRRQDKRNRAKETGTIIADTNSPFDMLSLTFEHDPEHERPFAILIDTISLKGFHIEDADTGERIDLETEEEGISLGDLGFDFGEEE